MTLQVREAGGAWRNIGNSWKFGGTAIAVGKLLSDLSDRVASVSLAYKSGATIAEFRLVPDTCPCCGQEVPE